jgi:hypothetical protein
MGPKIRRAALRARPLLDALALATGIGRAAMDVKYIWLDTDVGIKLVTGGTLDTINVKVNPWVFGVGVGYKF